MGVRCHGGLSAYKTLKTMVCGECVFKCFCCDMRLQGFAHAELDQTEIDDMPFQSQTKNNCYTVFVDHTHVMK